MSIVRNALMGVSAVVAVAAASSSAWADDGYVCSTELRPMASRMEVQTYLTTQPGCQGTYLFGGKPLLVCGDYQQPNQAACNGVAVLPGAVAPLFEKLVDAQHRKQVVEAYLNRFGHLNGFIFKAFFSP